MNVKKIADILKITNYSFHVSLCEMSSLLSADPDLLTPELLNVNVVSRQVSGENKSHNKGIMETVLTRLPYTRIKLQSDITLDSN